MKKIMLLLTLALFVMVSTMAVDSYTTAIVDSEAKVTITNPNSPIIIRAVEGLEIRQGESKPALTITNNMNVAVKVTGLDIEHKDLSFSLTSDSIPPKRSISVDLKVDDYCSAVPMSNIPVVFNADFLDGSKDLVGNARIATSIDLEVLKGELELIITEEKLEALWNDESAPDDIKYYYQRRELEAQGWDDNWIEIINPKTDFYKHKPGEYLFKACLGEKAKSPEKLVVITETLREKEEKARQQAEAEKYFKHEIKGLPESEDDDN